MSRVVERRGDRGFRRRQWPAWGIGLGILLLHLPALAAEVDWAAVEREATQMLQSYIRIDTSNPPGNEIKAARFLAEKFRKEGIETKVYEPKPGRGIVVARLRGSGQARPIVLLNHLDVVPVKPAEWTYPPFAAEIHDGYVYGRGAIDCKGPGTIEAMALILLKRSGIKLSRDVIFLGTGDEEVGGVYGAGWFVENHLAELGNPEIVLNEGSFIDVEHGHKVYEVSASEKTPAWLRLTATGTPGHGSTPPQETAPKRLIEALAKVIAYEAPLQVLPEVQQYYSTMAELESGAKAEAYRNLAAALQEPKLRADFLADPIRAALVRTTITPTVLQGSNKTNVIPREASAELDCRLLPGQDPQALVKTIEGVVADPNVKVEMILNFPPSASPVDNPLFAAIGTVARAEGAVVVPKMLRGFTDCHFFRARGIPSYGFIPFEIPEEDDRRMHGVDERVSVANLRDGTRRMMAILRALDEPDSRP